MIGVCATCKYWALKNGNTAYGHCSHPMTVWMETLTTKHRPIAVEHISIVLTTGHQECFTWESNE